MADNQEEEPNPQPHHVRNYYGENDTFDGVRLNAKRRKETSSSWPNQKCLSDIIMQRIVYSLHKQNSGIKQINSAGLKKEDDKIPRKGTSDFNERFDMLSEMSELFNKLHLLTQEEDLGLIKSYYENKLKTPPKRQVI